MQKVFLPFTAAILIPAIFFGQSPVLQKAIIVKRTIELNHISPRPVDDSFSIALFNSLLKRMDNRSLLFTDAEYKKLQPFSNKLDDELNGKSYGFYETLEALYKKALLRADSIINKLLQKPLDFTINETVTRSTKETELNFAADIPALSNRWLKYGKYVILSQLYDIAAGDSTGKLTIKTILPAHEAKLRERLKQAESKSIQKILDYPGGYSNYVKELYLNAVAMCFDPHSNYFSPEEKEQFKESLSTEELSFGLDLDENERGNIVIAHIAPGGPAWKSGDINKGDQLITLQWEGKEAMEIAGVSLEDVYEELYNPVNDRLVLKVKKADGTTRTVLLRKEKIENEENIVKSFILQGEKKIGYILLPSFYTEWENETGSSCANDVAKEIVKLKRDNIEGLILDVRYNGGGSLGEALDMIGIFVDEGPLMGQQQKTGKIQFLKDPNRGAIFSGPLGLMVNGQSASASEVLAASLQDYNRAVIIGSNSFGKATMQQIFALDTFSSKPMQTGAGKDAVKITVGKLYRLNGESAQLSGVKPDIQLPDAFDVLDYREKFYPAALTAAKAEKNNYYKPLPALPLAELAAKSAERVNAADEFIAIKQVIEEVGRQKDKPQIIPLKAEAYAQWEALQSLNMDKLKTSGIATKKISVLNHSLDKNRLQNDEYAQEINNAWLQSIGEDVYIREAFFVLCDLVNLQKR